ncbi:MAG: SLBB domain-containing protein [Enhydrobacter sp.]|nr:SLBB domain-containing protein [Enhydrobacter sp.]
MTFRRLFFLLLLVLSVSPQAFAAVEPVLRVGDVLTVSLPGEAAFNKDFQVDRRGQVVLPEVGGLKVAGMELTEATRTIRESLGKAYRDLERLTVTLKERKLLVTVLGYVKTPGTVELAGDATVQMAIGAAGGLAQGAQLDRFQLRRGKEQSNFDYKKYLDTGDVALLPELQPLDTIFVPASPLTGNVQIDFDGRTLAQSGDGAEERSSIKVFGEVNTPAIFAFKKDASAIDLIMRAGGVTRYAAVDQIRIINQGKPVVFNLQQYLDSGDLSHLPKIEPGATLFVPKQVEEIRRGALTVYVMGEVAKPGAFEGKQGASFIEILANAGGPTRFAETRQIRIMRADGKVDMFDLVRFTEVAGGKLPEVAAGDAIFVPEKTQSAEPSWLKTPPSRAVQVMGAVVKPGRYEWSDEMSLFDLLAAAGGPTARGDIAHIDILKSENDRARPVRFNLAAFMQKGGSLASVPKIQGGNVIMIPELPIDPSDNKSQWTRQASDQSIYVMGQVGAPGRYAFNSNLHFLDIISAANGPTGSADLRNVRVSHRNQAGAAVTKVNLARYFETGDESILPKVKTGDVIFVPDKNKDWLDEAPENTVRVIGSVGKPGRYRFSDNMTILDLLAEAGGPTPDAYQSKIVVVNLATGQDQARVFDLVSFAKSGDVRKLPVVRTGDTVYVPNTEQSEWKVFMGGVRDAVSILSLFALIARI